ncbi:MAG: hypothetical protein JWO38_4903 [Gemmataceae bacterium]|nr:hypothetical protein [Gemmataceae bacterium]
MKRDLVLIESKKLLDQVAELQTRLAKLPLDDPWFAEIREQNHTVAFQAGRLEQAIRMRKGGRS